jgi:hypothetical protein
MRNTNSLIVTDAIEAGYRLRACYVALLLLFLIPVSLMGQNERSQDVFEKMFVGAFDPDAWNGIVFDATAYGQRLPFAIRVGSKTGRFLDGDRIFDAVSTVGPHAPDGSYALVAWRNYPRTALITLEWSRIDRTTVVARLKAPPDIHLVLEAYSPYEAYFTGAYHISADGTQIIGDHPIDGHFASTARVVVATDRPTLGSGTFTNVTQLQKVMDAGRLINTASADRGWPKISHIGGPTTCRTRVGGRRLGNPIES